jgi:hypothetical protein
MTNEDIEEAEKYVKNLLKDIADKPLKYIKSEEHFEKSFAEFCLRQHSSGVSSDVFLKDWILVIIQGTITTKLFLSQ